jgi:hypothetical protein
MGDDLVAVFYEENLSGGECTLSDVRQRIVEELLLISRSREGGVLENKRPSIGRCGPTRGINVDSTRKRVIVGKSRVHD